MNRREFVQRAGTGMAVLLLAAVFCGGCLHKVQAPIPGAANQFDSDSYLTLVTTDSVIQATKQAITNNQFPQNILRNVAIALNDLTSAYDAADASYRVYHAAAVAGNPTVDQQADLTNKLNAVQTKTAALTAAKAGN
jgi:hypothetical protein